MDIQLDKQTEAKLRELARLWGCEPSEALARLVESAPVFTNDQARDGQSLYDLAKESGSIGIVNDLPSDLSTNLNHLDGFGQ